MYGTLMTPWQYWLASPKVFLVRPEKFQIDCYDPVKYVHDAIKLHYKVIAIVNLYCLLSIYIYSEVHIIVR